MERQHSRTACLRARFPFVAGVGLLFSGATRADADRLHWLDRLLPLGVIEASHVTGSIAGAVLLLLSQGLARRLDAAYYLTMITVIAGVVASLLKGFEYEEALLLIALTAVLRLSRPAFNRRAAFFATRFSTAWIAAVAAALVASVWLGLFAFKHVEYSQDLWWQFELEGNASRFLRGSVGAATAVLLFAVARLIGHAPHEVEPPSEQDLEDAGRIIAAQDSTLPYLVYLEDKALLFDDRREAFIMYGVQGRTWVALGDPVGRPALVPDLIRLFIARCDDYGGTPVFYEVGTKYLHHYADFGLTFVKVGEEARVDLDRFTLDGPRGARFRQLVRRLEKDGGIFRVLPTDEVRRRMDELRAVSDDWLRTRSVAEKGFSLGCFEPDYVARFPAAIVECGRRIEAFATLWPGLMGQEVSTDLMRHHRDAPKSVMEALFTHLMIWGRAEGYRWFVMGMRRCQDSSRRRLRRCGLVPGGCCTNTAHRSTTFRVCARSRTNSIRCGSRGISCIQAGSRCCTSQPTCPRWSRAALGGSSRNETHSPSSNARNSVVSRATLCSTSAPVVSA
jgi:phosphatidylglycerol lysyltransferase